MTFREINLQVIEVFCRKRNISTTDLAEKVGMTYVGLRKIIRENTTTVSTLTKIAEALNIPIQFFFMSEKEINEFSDFGLERFQELKSENENLKSEIADLKNKIIRLADRI